VYPGEADRFPAIRTLGEIGLREWPSRRAWFSDMEADDREAELLADATALSWVLSPTGTKLS